MDHRKSLVILLLLGIIEYCFLYFSGNKNANLNQQQRDERRLVARTVNTTRYKLTVKREKLVLMYTTFYEIRDWNANFTNCPYKCRVTTDRRDIASSDAVLFDLIKSHMSRLPIPPRRGQGLQDQIRVFAIIESPGVFTTQFNMKKYDNVFNWSMTYRRDSDYPMSYGSFSPFIGNETAENITPNTTLLHTKRQVAAMISRCNAESGRDAYIKQLQKVIPVDLYGNCGSYACNKSENCYAALGSRYKFWLSFENSICKEYITEKFFEAVRNGMVPIVFGYGPYSEIAPKGSYINVQHFPSAEALGKYLLYLDSHHEEYLKYFDWRRRFRFTSNEIGNSFWCGFCEKLHLFDAASDRKWYGSVDDWYRRNNTNASLCLNTKEFVTLYSHSKQ